ncbi:membrane protein [Brevibacillus reuszeri]|nr:HupE/UreJ family protein [Brevibacillus reuszeri]MED1861383.1 HupE/UreJ family protein [Brevibacillus reuszeri]GED69924.1 membrane protein [Brevibacillus reuszeri]
MSLSFRVLSLLSFFTCLSLLFLQPAHAHPYSAGYTTLLIGKEQTILSYAIDELSVIELTGADKNKNGMLETDEFNAVKDQFAQSVKKQLVIKIDGEGKEWTSLNNVTLQREGDASKIVLNAVFPPIFPGQAISLEDSLYANDPKTNYVDLLTIQYGNQKSTAALSGRNRSWTMLLTESDWAGLDQGIKQPQQPSINLAGQMDGASSAKSEQEGEASGWFSFFSLGMNHILSGYDHLLFLFSLLLARQTFKQYAMVITSFTIAHSLTLTLTVLGLISIPSSIVEPAIALSICYVAIENIFSKKVNNRWIVTFFFGLIHGMGFADLLMEMNLPKSELAVDIFSFNVGIEAVQLAIVAVLLPVLIRLGSWNYSKKAINVGSAIALCLGGIWFVERIFFS